MKLDKKKINKYKKIAYLIFLVLSINFTIADDYNCTEKWVCTEYGVCDGDYQYRTCTEINGCEYLENKPTTVISCGYYFGTPNSCGNGIIDPGETYLNCNKDIKLTIQDYFKCLNAGKNLCVYHKEYLTNGVFYGFIGFFILYYFFGPKK